MTTWLKHWSPVNGYLFPIQHTSSFSLGTREIELGVASGISSGAFWLTSPTLGNTFPCLWVPYDASDRVMLYLHGNGSTIWDMQSSLEEYARKLRMSVVAMEYPGYGPASGRPSEATIDDAVQVTFEHLTHSLGFAPDNIVIMGRSIGTGPATRLAANMCKASTPPAALALQSAYMSIAAIVRGLMGRWGQIAATIMFDRWESIKTMPGIKCPVLFLHGKEDCLIPPASHFVASCCHE